MRKTAIFRHIPQGARLSPGRLPEAKKRGGTGSRPPLRGGAGHFSALPSCGAAAAVLGGRGGNLARAQSFLLTIRPRVHILFINNRMKGKGLQEVI